MTTILYAADLYEAEGTAAADGPIYGLRSTVRTPESS